MPVLSLRGIRVLLCEVEVTDWLKPPLSVTKGGCTLILDNRDDAFLLTQQDLLALNGSTGALWQQEDWVKQHLVERRYGEPRAYTWNLLSPIVFLNDPVEVNFAWADNHEGKVTSVSQYDHPDGSRRLVVEVEFDLVK
jgi:hypothetical protein